METQARILVERGPSRVSPLTVPMMIANMPSGYVSIMTGAKGPNSTVVTACATGSHAIGDATEVIRRDPDNVDARRLLGRIYLRSIGDMQAGGLTPDRLGLQIQEAVVQYLRIRTSPSACSR